MSKSLKPTPRQRHQVIVEVLNNFHASSEAAVNNQQSPKATFYLPQTQEWYYLGDRTDTSNASKAAFLQSLTECCRDLSPKGRSIDQQTFLKVKTLPQMNPCTPKTSTSFIKKLWIHRSNLLNKDAINLVLSMALIFMLTCIGSMLILCFFFEIEKWSLSPTTEPQRTSDSPTPDVSAQTR